LAQKQSKSMQVSINRGGIDFFSHDSRQHGFFLPEVRVNEINLRVYCGYYATDAVLL
jgi:hypothetical protein